MPRINWENIDYRWHFIRRLECEIILNSLKDIPSRRTIDIACGDGQLSDWVVQKTGARVFGIDINRNLVMNVRPRHDRESNTHASVLVGDVHALPFSSFRFGVVICNCSMEHFDHVSRVLAEIRRILAPDGMLVGTVDSFSRPNITEEEKQIHARRYHVVNYFSKASLTALLAEFGFGQIRMQYYLRSCLSQQFFRFFSRRGFQGRLFETFSPLMYHLAKISDRLAKSDSGGYGLAFACRK